MSKLNVLTMLCGVAALSACGGGGGGGSVVAPLTSLEELRADRAEIIRLQGEVSASGPTSASSVPTTGSADFAGPASITYTQADVTSIWLGDTEVNVDFEANTLTGTAENFNYVENDANNPDAGPLNISSATGSLTFENGAISTASRNIVSTEVNGTLTTPDHTVTLDNNLVGSFAGATSPDILTIGGSSEDGTSSIVVDGTNVDSTTFFVLED